jgi:hypothetical protein
MGVQTFNLAYKRER